MGLAALFTVKAKILIKKLWIGGVKILAWDDPIPLELNIEWIDFFGEMFEISKIKLGRCVKPVDAVSIPILILLSDGSEDAHGCCACIRWKLSDGTFQCHTVPRKEKKY